MRALLVLAILTPAIAHADRDLCEPTAQHHGAAIDLDVEHADIRDVLRLLADAGHVNLVVANDVDGKVTLRVKHVAWDAATCSIAAINHLVVTIADNILMVRRAR